MATEHDILNENNTWVIFVNLKKKEKRKKYQEAIGKSQKTTQKNEKSLF